MRKLKEKERSLRKELEMKKRDEERREKEKEYEREEGRRLSEKLEAVRNVLLEALVL